MKIARYDDKLFAKLGFKFRYVVYRPSKQNLTSSMVILHYWREKEREEKREKIDKNKCLYICSKRFKEKSDLETDKTG